MTDHHLRPIERTVRRLRQGGLTSSEVAWRLRRSPGYVRRVEELSEIERVAPSADHDRPEIQLRPIERCVLNSLEAGTGYAEIAARLRRTPDYVSRVERLANLRLERASV